MQFTAVVVFAALAAFSIQTSGSAWEALSHELGEREVHVQTINGDEITGRIRRVDGSNVTIGDPPFQRVVPRTSVCRVTSGTDSTLKRVTLMGVLAASGYFAGLLMGGRSDDPHQQKVDGFIGAGIGATVGGLIRIQPAELLYVNPDC